jgi:hypothetical protein
VARLTLGPPATVKMLMDGLSPASTVGQFTVGPDKNVWFTETTRSR